MRTAAEVNNVYFNLLLATANNAKESLNDKNNNYEDSSFPMAVLCSNLLFTFEECWNYLTDQQKDEICDIASSLMYESKWE